ncbi:MAG: hypothetical protein JW744_04715 [Candidatus Diapherotrites archaeon]|uniref:Uncharacterized protein n=1 Tax=Candidatus Iainarchaeum sp. TaxID=3101447 RepID=A0A939C7K2_9ARCH|nr:hypothetical protein [Candidatus Diapherotrites archaeon]
MGAITVSKKGNELSLQIPEREAKELGLSQNAGYELVKARPGIWVLTEKQAEKENPTDRKVFRLLREKSLKERVEGKFESFLGKEELPRFREMLKEGSVVAFKLSSKYKKAVYKSREEIEKEETEGKIKPGQGKQAGETAGKEQEKEAQGTAQGKGQRQAEEQGTSAGKGQRQGSENAAGQSMEKGQGKDSEKAIDEYSLEKEGFVVCRNEQRAKSLSQELKKEIEDGQIKGIKSFDGFFYIIETELYEKYAGKVLETMRNSKTISSKELAEKTGLSPLLVRIICEFLKEDGEIIEKRKDLLQAV